MTKSWVVAKLYHHFHKVFRQLLVKRIVKYNDHSSLTTSGGDSRPYSDSRLSSDSRPYSDSRLTTRGGNSSQKSRIKVGRLPQAVLHYLLVILDVILDATLTDFITKTI